ncbi:hypothetical protein AAFF_G00372970 [Aldrovandia affinis]|uniref:Uncharacterized protein n=1 Tax=Aldrovandia affinis TaxID=143900 RepID=A0AAD7SGF7_9TELE|nr:hypothetical protein AAFF_G00372970 [Aldrovandia affinis]
MRNGQRGNVSLCQKVWGHVALRHSRTAALGENCNSERCKPLANTACWIDFGGRREGLSGGEKGIIKA